MLQKTTIDKIKELIINAGTIALSHHGSKLDIETKNDNSPVTNVDKLLSHYIVEALSKISPDIPAISEEGEAIKHAGRFFLIDPIDGTKSYIKGEDSYTINIGLIEDGVPTYGFVYQPSKRLLHYTNESQKLVAEMGGRDVTQEVSERHVDGCIIAVSHRSRNDKETKEFINKSNATGIVEVSSSIKLCMIADGSADIYPRFGTTMEWDIAAGHALIIASGGDVIAGSERLKYNKVGLCNSNFIAYSRNYLNSCKLDI